MMSGWSSKGDMAEKMDLNCSSTSPGTMHIAMRSQLSFSLAWLCRSRMCAHL